MHLRLLTLLILALAAALNSAAFFYLLAVLVGLQLVTWLWVRQAAHSLRWSRHLPTAVFPGEQAEVRLLLENTSRLPVPWLALYESLPPSMRLATGVRQVISLGPREQRTIIYNLQGHRRGLYPVGPLQLRTGDVLGLYERSIVAVDRDYLVVYPTVLPLAELGLPAELPFGAWPRAGSLFHDPARPAGPRPYQSGDSMRQIDWKSSAHSGALLVRRYEPAIARQSLLALAFSRSEYPTRFLIDSLERAAVTAASLAADLVARRQPVGLCSSGLDGWSNLVATPLPPGTGHAHLDTLLRMLGRLEASAEGDIGSVLEQASAGLSWGSSVILICAGADAALIARLLPLQRRGLRLVLVLVEGNQNELAMAQRAGMAGYLVGRSGVPVSARSSYGLASNS